MATIPGIDIFEQWMQGARGATAGLPAWASPTLDPEELGKRIEELRTVQFWLEQNAKLIASSIQALEVQRMTLATLKSMNVPLADLGAALRMPTAGASAFASAFAAPPASGTSAAAVPPPKAEPRPDPEPVAPKTVAPEAPPAPASSLADPMQWWGGLAQQFSALASQAVKDSAKASQEVSEALARSAAVQDRRAAEAALKGASPRTQKSKGAQGGPTRSASAGRRTTRSRTSAKKA